MYVFGSGRRRRLGGEWMRGLGLGFTNPVGTCEVLDVCLGLGCGCVRVGGVDVEWVGGLEPSLEEWGGVMSMCVVSLYSLCICQIQE